MDLFVERIDGEQYEYEGEMRPLDLIEEEITVKGEEEPERLIVRSTHHGPIVNEALGADPRPAARTPLGRRSTRRA